MKDMQTGKAVGCRACPLSRRQFLSGCAAGLGAAALSTCRLAPCWADAVEKARVRLVWTYVPSTGPIWPNIGYDFEARKKQILDRLVPACPGVELLPVWARNGNEARKLLEEDKDKGMDGYLVYMLGLWTGAPQAIGRAGKPTLFVDDLYGGSGEWLIAHAEALRRNSKVVGISTSRLEDVADAVNCFAVLKRPGAGPDDFVAAAVASRRRNTKSSGAAAKEDPVTLLDLAACQEKLKAAKILVVGADPGGNKRAIEEVFGTQVQKVEFKELDEAYQKADREAARKQAEAWIQAAAKVVEPTSAEIEKSAGMYLAMREVMRKHEAQAITINCLGGFYGGQLKAYPCLGFYQLNNDGLVGACEADLHSTITMLSVGTLTGRPGYISDPVLDTSKNQIIYAHCVASAKVFGPKGATNPYLIRSHSEDRKGAVVQSLMPVGHMTTTVELRVDQKTAYVHQAVAVDNIDEDKACRTKLAAEVKGDIEQLMRHWDRCGWHRVTFYGDIREPVLKLAEALGFKVVEEAAAAAAPAAPKPGGDVPPGALERVGSNERLADWANPKDPCDPAFKNIAVGWDEAVRYRFRGAGPCTVVFGLCEGHHEKPGQRVLELQIEGKTRKTVDVVAEKGRNVPVLYPFEAKDENGDGWIEIAVAPAPDSPDTNAVLNVLWIFEGKDVPALDDVKAGRLAKPPLARAACGQEP